MATQQIHCSWTHGSALSRNDVRRAGQTLAQFCAAHVADVLAGNAGGDDPLECDPLYTHVVVWTKDNIERTQTCSSCTSQADADAIAAALVTAVQAAGGTVTTS